MKTILVGLLSILIFILSGCSESKEFNTLRFATSAEYPPFEYKLHGELVGFDIALAKLLAKELGKKATFQDMQFSAVLPAVQSGMADIAISTITITKAREKNFDFSTPYYKESMAIIYPRENPITDKSQLSGKKIACQLGTTMEVWLKKHAPNTEIMTTDSNPQAVEALKAGYVDGVLIDAVQAKAFSYKNNQLMYKVIGQADTGYGLAFRRGSPLKAEINKALASLEKKGILKKLKAKYLENPQWKD